MQLHFFSPILPVITYRSMQWRAHRFKLNCNCTIIIIVLKQLRKCFSRREDGQKVFLICYFLHGYFLCYICGIFKWIKSMICGSSDQNKGFKLSKYVVSYLLTFIIKLHIPDILGNNTWGLNILSGLLFADRWDKSSRTYMKYMKMFLNLIF